VVHAGTRDWKRRLAAEPKAQAFADELRRLLLAEPSGHPDPVHEAPTDGERACLDYRAGLDKAERYQLVRLVLAAPHDELPALPRADELDGLQLGFLVRALRHRVAER
jgi:hypothetical protein